MRYINRTSGELVNIAADKLDFVLEPVREQLTSDFLPNLKDDETIVIDVQVVKTDSLESL